MKIGICGFPQSGKSTLFEALSGLPPLTPGKRSEEHIGSVNRSEKRPTTLERASLERASRIGSITPAAIALLGVHLKQRAKQHTGQRAGHDGTQGQR